MIKMYTMCAAAVLVLGACGGGEDDAVDQIAAVEQAADDAAEAVEELEATIDSLADQFGGVDREGSVRSIVEAIEAQGITIDTGCVTDALAAYTDDELLAYDAELMTSDPSEEAQQFGRDVLACADLGS